MNKKKTKLGRPPLPKGQVKGKIVPMRLNDDDLRSFSKAAKASKKPLSEWMRDTLRSIANSEP